MCGGIAGSLASLSVRSSKSLSWRMLIAYNTGRISSYMLAGLLAGWLGNKALTVFSPEHVVSIGLTLSGLFLLALGLYLSGWWQGLAAIERAGFLVWKRIEPWGKHLLPIRYTRQALVLGLLWGWLPCGLVYATLIWSLANADPLRSAAMMGAFGLGTLPMLVTLGSAARAIANITRQKKVRQLAGTAIILFGLLTLFGVIAPIHLGTHPVDEMFCGPDYLPSEAELMEGANNRFPSTLLQSIT
ncbi:MAG: sulfite exporter TauE/SafE family protein [Proteobacteria bacterium]|nr:sulfite exporter TauE/SafE family protein [Pseudomonadota bacterium]